MVALRKYIRRIAEEGVIVGYGVTEPEAGSNVQSLKTKAERVLDEAGNIKGYKINGQKQFITNGGVAELFTVLADTPEGPSFFVVERGTEGLTPGKHEDKHGIRASNTCSLTLEDLYVPVDNLVGGVEGQGLKQANEVFGYTRLMVATFGLGGGMAALEKGVAYSKERVQFGTTLSEKQGYTHKLLVPNAARLEAARAYIEEVADRLDTDDEDLQVEGSIAKYFATEVGDTMANDAIQALGGYGYTEVISTAYNVHPFKELAVPEKVRLEVLHAANTHPWCPFNCFPDIISCQVEAEHIQNSCCRALLQRRSLFLHSMYYEIEWPGALGAIGVACTAGNAVIQYGTMFSCNQVLHLFLRPFTIIAEV